MTSQYLIADLKRDEGYRAEAYPDPISHGAPFTIGYGHTGPEVHEGLCWTEADAEKVLSSDVLRTDQGLDAALPWWRSLDDIRQDCLFNMAFNLGVAKLLTFDTFLGFVKAGEYPQAALDMLGTAWAHEVKARAKRLSKQMATGVHQP